MRLSVCSAYYGKEEMTLEFLDNLATLTGDVEMILTNAASKPIDHPFVTQRVDLPKNYSHANSMNAALKRATGDFVCELGNDVFPEDACWLESLVEIAKQTKAYIVSPLANTPELTNRVEDVRFVPGICWLFSRECLDNIGFFDERFVPGTWDDNDYCRRVNLFGGRIVVDGSTNVRHIESATINDFGAHQVLLTNRQRYIEKWGDDRT